MQARCVEMNPTVSFRVSSARVFTQARSIWKFYRGMYADIRDYEPTPFGQESVRTSRYQLKLEPRSCGFWDARPIDASVVRNRMFGADRYTRSGHVADRVAKRKPGARSRFCVTSRDSSWDLLPCACGCVWTFTAISRSSVRLRYCALRWCGLPVVSCLESISGRRNCISSERAASSIPDRPD